MDKIHKSLKLQKSFSVWIFYQECQQKYKSFHGLLEKNISKQNKLTELIDSYITLIQKEIKEKNIKPVILKSNINYTCPDREQIKNLILKKDEIQNQTSNLSILENEIIKKQKFLLQLQKQIKSFEIEVLSKNEWKK